MDDRLTFAHLLRRHREGAGLTQEELARRAGLSVRAISDLERGVKQAPHPSTMRMLAEALGLRPREAAIFTKAPRQHYARADKEPEMGSPPDPITIRGGDTIPTPLTSFVGRAPQIEDVKHLLEMCRLVTLTGSGGCGKTRLAIQVARGVQHAYLDGVWFADLSRLADPSLVAHAVLAALGLGEEPGRSSLATLTEHLRRRHLLLLLDNCEHLIEECARLAAALLPACPRVSMLATSRELLGVTGEAVYRVPSLTAPRPDRVPSADRLAQYEAAQLFVERARLVRRDFVVTAANAPAVAEICRRLDGIPLAIELAAARARFLPVEQIAARLDDRFRLLANGGRAALPRQQTLRGAVDWSYDLLTGQERLAFQRCAAFAGGWTLDAAEVVCAGPGVEPDDVLPVLARLVDRSLVIAEDDGSGAERYRFLETLRQYAEERLVASGEGEATRARQAAHYLRAAEETQQSWKRTQSPVYLNRLQAEFDNLRAALRWLIERRDGERAMRLILVMGTLWEHLGCLTEGRARLEEVLELTGSSPILRARVAQDAGWLAWRQGDWAAAESWWKKDLAIRKALGDMAGVAFALNWLGVVLRDRGAYDAARAALEESLALCRDLGDGLRTADSLARLGSVAHATGALAEARRQYEESLALREELGDEHLVAWTCFSLALLALDQGDLPAARSLAQRSAPLFRAVDDKRAILHALALFACVAAAADKPDRAVRLAGAVDGLSEATTVRLPVPYREKLERWLAAARQALDPDAADSACAEGRSMTQTQAIAYAMAATGN